jgi:hypothetical protein
LKEEAESVMQQLVTCVQCTAELYHEMHALDRFEQDYQRKQQEEDGSSVHQRGENLNILKQEVKSQRKHVQSLQKKSLWSKNLEEVGHWFYYSSCYEQHIAIWKHAHIVNCEVPLIDCPIELEFVLCNPVRLI